MVTEVYARGMTRLGIRILGHHRYDEALSILDQHRLAVVEHSIQDIADKYRKFKNKTAKIIISGRSAILALEM